MEARDLYSMATLLDPRFKLKGFSSASFAEMAKSKVIEKAKEISSTTGRTTGEQECQEAATVVSSSKKKKKQSTLWEEFDKDG